MQIAAAACQTLSIIICQVCLLICRCRLCAGGCAAQLQEAHKQIKALEQRPTPSSSPGAGDDIKQTG